MLPRAPRGSLRLSPQGSHWSPFLYRPAQSKAAAPPQPPWYLIGGGGIDMPSVNLTGCTNSPQAGRICLFSQPHRHPPIPYLLFCPLVYDEYRKELHEQDKKRFGTYGRETDTGPLGTILRQGDFHGLAFGTYGEISSTLRKLVSTRKWQQNIMVINTWPKQLWLRT